MIPSRNRWVWIGSIVAVAVIAVVAMFSIWIPFRGSSPRQPAAIPPAPVYAPQGELVPQFPKNLIIDSAAAIGESYSLTYSSNINQYTAQSDSSSSMATLYEDYLQFLPKQGWTITNNLTAFQNSKGISATNASSSIQVSIVANHSGSQATVTYVTK